MAHPSTLLRSFIVKDSIENAHSLIGDDSLLNLILAWRRIGVKWDPPNEIKNGATMSDNELWNALWEHTIYNAEDLASASGLSVIRAQQKLLMARQLYLVYPDGDVSESAIQFIQTKVVGEIHKATKGLSQSSEPKETNQAPDTPEIKFPQ